MPQRWPSESHIHVDNTLSRILSVHGLMIFMNICTGICGYTTINYIDIFGHWPVSRLYFIYARRNFELFVLPSLREWMRLYLATCLLAYFREVVICDLQPVCLSPLSINFWMPEPILMKLGRYIMGTRYISTVYFINPSHESVCLYVCPSYRW
jgi:hypothetical protein